MLKVFGKNNNNLLRRTKKQTFSMPQSVKNQPSHIRKCACGQDFIAVIGNSDQERNILYFLFQGQFHQIKETGPVFDIAISETTLGVITINGDIMVWQFDQQKTRKGMISFSKIRLDLEEGDSFTGIYMGGNDIFLNTEEGRVYYFQKNQWYETKTFSNTQLLQLSTKIIQISSGPKNNLFLTYDGKLYQSSKQDPLSLHQVKSKEYFIKIATYNYCAAITKKGTIFIWGDSIHGKYEYPTQLAKLTKKFMGIWLDKDNGFALSDDGQIWAWGLNQNGQLGLSDYQRRLKPFPIVTLDKYKILDLFCGESYTVCLCHPISRNQNNDVSVVNRRVSGFQILRQHSKQSLASFMKKQELLYEESSFQIRSPSPNIPKNKTHVKKTPSHTHSQKQNRNSCLILKTPNNKRKSPILFSSKEQNRNKSQRKISNVSEKPKVPQRSKSPKMLKIYKHRDIGTNTYNYQQNMCNQLFGDDNNQSRQNTFVYEKQSTQIIQKEEMDQLIAENTQLKQQNALIQKKVRQKDQLIKDITAKIRLLEEAIDQYERSLTERDNTVESHQQKQRNYLLHINHLQKSLNQMIKVKENNQEITVVYDNLQKDFEQQRDSYLQKIKETQMKMEQQRRKNNQQIQIINRQYQQQLLKIKEQSRRRKDETIQIKYEEDNKENGMLYPKTILFNNDSKSCKKMKQFLHLKHETKQWSTPSPILKARTIDQVPTFNYPQHLQGNQKVQVIHSNSQYNNDYATPPEHTDTQMKQMIRKIELSKSRIQQYANKLVGVLDIPNRT